jgi:hypothetical protein
VRIDQNRVRESDKRFIEQEYLSRVHPSEVEQDNGTAVWATMYLYFRSGKFYEMKQFIDEYKGSLSGNLLEFDAHLRTYFQRDRKMKNKFVIDNLAGSKLLNGDIFQRMLLVILAKHNKVPCEELLYNMEDFIWFFV